MKFKSKLTLYSIMTVILAAVFIQPQAAQNWTGSGGKGTSLTILAPRATGLAEDQNYIPTLIQGEFVSNFSTYSAISILDWEQRDALLVRLLSGSYSDSVSAEAALEIGNAVPTTHFMLGNITKTTTGYNLQISITRSTDKTTVASFSKSFTFGGLDDLTAIRQASLELLPKLGVTLTAKAQQELAGAAPENRVTAQTALARGVTAQRQGTEVAAMSYYFRAAAFDPSLKEAVNRSSILNANISSGNMGDNIRNEIQWRKQWVDRLTETERFFDELSKTESMPYTLFYSDEIQQGVINFQDETVELGIETLFRCSHSWRISIEQTLQAVYDGLAATGKAKDWGLEHWPHQGVTDLNAFAERHRRFSVVFELRNNQNKIIGEQTLKTGGSWGLDNQSGRPRFTSGPGLMYAGPIMYFQGVNANDVTEKMTVRVATVNGTTAQTAVESGILRIRLVTNGEKGSFTDSRDGKKYRTVRAGLSLWMAENLNFKTDKSWCYDNKESNCQKYGRLYDWDAAITACPAGWYLPSEGDWIVLREYAKRRTTSADKTSKTTGDLRHGLRGLIPPNIADKTLKTTSGWRSNDNGTDEFGFSALPGGYRFPNGTFNEVGERGHWWSSSGRSSSRNAWNSSMGRATVPLGDGGNGRGFSVRCLLEE